MKNLEIKNLEIKELINPKFVKPIRINYTQNKKEKSWEAVKSHDSVSVLLYHIDKECFVLVKQFRPPVYINDNVHKYTYELCAGIVDKDLSLEEITREEILEECGYDVKVEEIEKITSFYTNVGISGAKQHLYFANLEDNMKVNEGGGISEEEIVLEYLSLKDAQKFVFDESKAKTPGLMFAFYWFFETNKKFLFMKHMQ